jgi:iron(III) transport system ATP-binding protein
MRFEIRRLHEDLHITTLYVTHDQAEAMVTSDRIAVMRLGQIEQVGTAEEIYERPRTAFVAGFVGRTNLLRGMVEDATTVRVGPAHALRVADTAGIGRGEPALVSVRPHRVVVLADGADARAVRDRGDTLLEGTVSRAVYFGDALDVQVALRGSDLVIRLATLPEARLRVGQPVTLGIAPEACVLLPPDRPDA